MRAVSAVPNTASIAGGWAETVAITKIYHAAIVMANAAWPCKKLYFWRTSGLAPACAFLCSLLNLIARRQTADGFAGEIEGPKTRFAKPLPSSEFLFRVVENGRGWELLLDGRRARLAPAEYTDCQPLQFRTALGVHVAGIARFLLSPPEFSVYMSPIQIDPARPATAGMAEDTWALNEGVIDEDAFLRQAYAIFEERERMFLTPSRPRAAAWWPALSIPVIAYSTCSTAGWAPGIRMPA